MFDVRMSKKFFLLLIKFSPLIVISIVALFTFLIYFSRTTGPIQSNLAKSILGEGNSNKGHALFPRGDNSQSD